MVDIAIWLTVFIIDRIAKIILRNLLLPMDEKMMFLPEIIVAQ